eukprot:31563-Pelagococcus_subviridis.AAC.1
MPARDAFQLKLTPLNLTPTSLRGAAPATRELSHWLDEILTRPRARLFVAGDASSGRATDFVPAGFEIGNAIASYARVVRRVLYAGPRTTASAR